MAKDKQSSGAPATEVWAKIDSTVINVIGKRVFYQLTDAEGGTNAAGGRKSVAVVTGKVSGDKPIQNRLRVYPCHGGEPFTTTAPLDSGRNPGTYELAKEGDLVE